MRDRGAGHARLKVDDLLSQLFRSDTGIPTIRSVTAFSSEFDVLVVVEGKNLMARVDREAALISSLTCNGRQMRGLISSLSARQPPEEGKLPAPVFLEQATGAEYDALAKRVLTNEIIRGKLFVGGWHPALVKGRSIPRSSAARLKTTVGEIRKTMQEDLGGTGLTVQPAGVPTMQLEICNAVERDTLYNTIGFAAGCLIAIVFFRISFMIIAVAPPLIAILLSLGALVGLLQPQHVLNVMTPLIMVISFRQHAAHACGALIDRRKDKYTAFREAVLVVGPACVDLTALLGFRSLHCNSSSEAICTLVKRA